MTVTAGNASELMMVSFIVMGSEEATKKENIQPLARLVSYAISGVPNDVMGEGPILATEVALKKRG